MIKCNFAPLGRWRLQEHQVEQSFARPRDVSASPVGRADVSYLATPSAIPGLGRRAEAGNERRPSPGHQDIGALRRRASTAPSAGRSPGVTGARQSGLAIRRCVSCGQNACVNGQQCGYDPGYGGVFEANQIENVVRYNQAHNYPSNRQREFEHPLARAALQNSGVAHNYHHEFTIQTDRSTHRNAVDGAGGGISSTGRSSTAQGWANHMGQLIAQNPVEAVRLAAVEQLNAHDMSGTLSLQSLNGIVQWLQGQVTDGRITMQDFERIANHITQTWAQRTYGNQ